MFDKLSRKCTLLNVRCNGGFFLFFVVRSAVPDEAVVVFDCEMRSTSVNMFERTTR